MSTPKDSVIILGIDPGTRITGYGIIAVERGGIKALDFGCIRPPPSLSLYERYAALYDGINHLIEKFNPSAVAVETQFVHKNIQIALKLGMARGSVLIPAAKKNIPIFEYAPRKAKLAVVGNGAATKEQVQKMIQRLLALPSIPPEDAGDALAIALCHAHTLSFSQKIIGSKCLST